MTTTYVVPDHPADPETAALELIVRLPADLLQTDAFTSALQDSCTLLDAEGAFDGLSWADAKAIAAVVAPAHGTLRRKTNWAIAAVPVRAKTLRPPTRWSNRPWSSAATRPS